MRPARRRWRSVAGCAGALLLVLSACGERTANPAASSTEPAVPANAGAAPAASTALPPETTAPGPAAAEPQRPLTGAMPRSAAGLPQMELEIKGERFILEMAMDEPTRRRGLSGRPVLMPGRGMIFVHDRPQTLGYWMWECLIDIDMIYLDREGRVTATHRMKKEPPRRPNESEIDYARRLPHYSSMRPAVFAIELPTGSLDRLDLRLGEVIEFDHEGLRRLAAP